MDKNRVMNEGPWTFDNHMLLLKDLSGDEQSSDIMFDTMAFWVRAYDVPFGMRSGEYVKMFASRVGVLIKYDETPGLIWDSSIRFEVATEERHEGNGVEGYHETDTTEI